MLERMFMGAGALVEREYRLLFAATFVTSLGDAVGLIALTFAVLSTGSATDLGIVLASRQIAVAVVLVFGGVLADRMPRDRLLVGAALAQGGAQAAAAAFVLSGHGSLWMFVATSALWGLGDGVVTPTETGLVPQTVSAGRLQQANALQGLSRSGVRVLGPAIGGLLVVATSPGWALAADSASFFLSAALIGRMSLPAGPARVRERFFAELRDGWREFTSLTWLWTTVVLFGLGNISLMFWQVLGPAIAKQHLGGAGAWATILSAGGVGAIIGGIYALRHRPARPLVAAILWPLLVVPEYVLLANTAHVWLIAAAALVGGIGISVHIALWFTVFQTEVPEHARSRVASYDALGSMVLTPIGAAIAGPVAVAVGNSAALWLAGLSIVACNAAMLAIPSVWTIHARGPQAGATSAA